METETSLAHLQFDELEHLFKFIPSTRLLNFRLICKKWEEVTRTVLGKRGDICLILKYNFDFPHNIRALRFLQTLPKSGFVASTIVIKSLRDGNSIHVDFESGVVQTTVDVIADICHLLGKRCHVRHLCVLLGFHSGTPPFGFVLLLLRYLSTSLESLKIDRLPYASLTLSDKTISTVQSYFSKSPLKSLRKLEYDLDTVGPTPVFLQWLRILLQAAPNLTSILPTSGERNCVIPFLLETSRVDRLNEISINSLEGLDIILDKMPPLHSLVLSCDFEYKDIPRLQEYIGNQSLKSMVLGYGFIQTVLNNHRFLQLRTLILCPFYGSLKGYSEGVLWTPFSLCFSRNTPNLKTLKISLSNFYNWNVNWRVIFCYSENTGPCNFLRELKIDAVLNDDPEFFPFLARVFPNLKKLSWTQPTEVDLLGICTSWTDLEELSLRYSRHFYNGEFGPGEHHFQLDQRLFGITQEWKNGIDVEGKEWWMELSPPDVRFGTLADLTNLKVLKIKTLDMKEQALTDFSLYFGFAKLQLLEKLYILNLEDLSVASNPKVTLTAGEFIVKKLPKLDRFVEGIRWMRRGKMVCEEDFHDAT